MPALTRRLDPDVAQETWRIYYGDVHAGTIMQSVGNPGAAPKWQWSCGFYPGSRPGECTGGTAVDFDQARIDFESAWRAFLSKRTEADFSAWREQQEWTAEKYRRFDRGERMPHDWRASGLIATPDVIPGGRTERAIDLRFLQLASDIRSNRRDTQLLSVATRKHDLCESGFLSLPRPEKKRSCQIIPTALANASSNSSARIR